MAVATLLDPCFKKVGFTDASSVDQAIRRLQGEVRAMIENEAQGQQVEQNDESRSNDQQTDAVSNALRILQQCTRAACWGSIQL